MIFLPKTHFVEGVEYNLHKNAIVKFAICAVLPKMQYVPERKVSIVY